MITVKILDTAGSLDNLALLIKGQADIGFVQGGVPAAGDHKLEALGSLYFEPLWLFHRRAVGWNERSEFRHAVQHTRSMMTRSSSLMRSGVDVEVDSVVIGGGHRSGVAGDVGQTRRGRRAAF